MALTGDWVAVEQRDAADGPLRGSPLTTVVSPSGGGSKAVASERGDIPVLEAGSFRYAARVREVWRFTVKELIVAGEWTNNHGPAVDYLYLFIAGRPASVFEAPMYANSRLPVVVGSLRCRDTRELRSARRWLVRRILSGLEHQRPSNSAWQLGANAC